MTEQDQESAPLPRHQFDMVPTPVRQIFEDILKYRVDPSGNCYGVELDTLVNQLQALDNQAVAAIDSDTSYSEKGHMYDPILQSFIQGAGGRISNWEQEQDSMTPLGLRGVTKRIQMAACRDAG